MELNIKRYDKESLQLPIYEINGIELNEVFLSKNNIFSIGYGGGGYFDDNKPYEIVFKKNIRQRYLFNNFENFIKKYII